MATTGGRIMTMEQEFFEAFGIEPTMLCNCSYKNLQEYRYEYGDDVCEHIDDFEFSCKDCEKSKKSIPYYPPITSDIVLKLINIILKARGEFRIIGSFSKIEVLMNNVLKACISIAPEIQDQVKALFNAM